MPIPTILHAISEGPSSVPYLVPFLKIVPWVIILVGLKFWFGGSQNVAERNMHSKVVMITGGTSGIGASVAHELASRGAQLVLLTQHALTDTFLVDYIMDLRTETGNELITAEQVDLASLHSIRQFATKWIDNAPPRRLDLIILCADTQMPSDKNLQVSEDGVEVSFAVNYLANFHLLSILSPALRAQPPHRDVRVIVPTCSSYIGAPREYMDNPTVPRPSKDKNTKRDIKSPRKAYSISKLALMTFATAFQKHLESYKRPDGAPMNARIIMADPGWSRTPGMRRWLTSGSLLSLAFYLATYPIWWLVLKSPLQGAQTILYAAMEADFERGKGGRLVKECRDIDFARDEITVEETQKKLWEVSEKAIEVLEKEGAIRRTEEKKADEKAKRQGERDKQSEKKAASRKSRKS